MIVRRIIGKIRKTFFFREGHIWRAKSKKCKIIVISVKLKVDGTKVYFGSKWLFLSFFALFLSNQQTKYDLTDDFGQ